MCPEARAHALEEAPSQRSTKSAAAFKCRCVPVRSSLNSFQRLYINSALGLRSHGAVCLRRSLSWTRGDDRASRCIGGVLDAKPDTAVWGARSDGRSRSFGFHDEYHRRTRHGRGWRRVKARVRSVYSPRRHMDNIARYLLPHVLVRRLCLQRKRIPPERISRRQRKVVRGRVVFL